MHMLGRQAVAQNGNRDIPVPFSVHSSEHNKPVSTVKITVQKHFGTYGVLDPDIDKDPDRKLDAKAKLERRKQFSARVAADNAATSRVPQKVVQEFQGDVPEEPQKVLRYDRGWLVSDYSDPLTTRTHLGPAGARVAGAAEKGRGPASTSHQHRRSTEASHQTPTNSGRSRPTESEESWEVTFGPSCEAPDGTERHFTEQQEVDQFAMTQQPSSSDLGLGASVGRTTSEVRRDRDAHDLHEDRYDEESVDEAGARYTLDQGYEYPEQEPGPQRQGEFHKEETAWGQSVASMPPSTMARMRLLSHSEGGGRTAVSMPPAANTIFHFPESRRPSSGADAGSYTTGGALPRGQEVMDHYLRVMPGPATTDNPFRRGHSQRDHSHSQGGQSHSQGASIYQDAWAPSQQVPQHPVPQQQAPQQQVPWQHRASREEAPREASQGMRVTRDSAGHSEAGASPLHPRSRSTTHEPTSTLKPRAIYDGHMLPIRVRVGDSVGLARMAKKVQSMDVKLPALCSCGQQDVFDPKYVWKCASNCPMAGRPGVYEHLLTGMLQTFGILRSSIQGAAGGRGVDAASGIGSVMRLAT
eukprot:gene19996-26709_t